MIVLVVLVPPCSADVVPRRRLMAPEALVDPRVVLARHRLRHHLEVHHEVARRRLVALEAFHRGR